MSFNHMHRCPCEHHSRRGFLALAATGVGASLVGAQPALAAGHCEAVLLNCMDYRLQNETEVYMEKLGLRDNYDQLVLAGASLGAVTPKRRDWGVTFNEHLATAIELHDIKRVIVLDHRDCGAYRLLLGEAAVKNPQTELETHALVMRRLRSRLRKAHPNLSVELGLMALDGTVETIA